MKVAICFTGTGRSLQYTYKNINDKLINSFDNCDLFFTIAKNPHSYKIEKYFSEDKTKVCLIEEEPSYNIDTYRFKHAWPLPPSTPQVYIKMINSRRRCAEILENHSKENNIVYDCVIFSRLDVKYFADVATSLKDRDLTKLYIPDFHNVFGGAVNGYNDRFAASNQENLLSYLKASDHIEEFLNKGGYLHAETFLKWHVDKEEIDVEKIPIRFGRVRSTGQEIDNRIRYQSTWRPTDT